MNVDSAKAVFLSYASQDAEAARCICESLRSGGIEVWFDLNELVGGDAWDQKIRRQIKECALFVPIISANTQARPEGYFRLEWRLADQRTHLMGRSKTFLLPVCLDDTHDADADVPDSFLAAQWVRLPAGEAGPAFGERVRVLLSGASPGPAAASRAPWRDENAAPSPRTGEKTAAADKAVAVLAFANLSRDADNEYFSDGISEELLNVLAKVPGLRVAARTSAFFFKGKNIPAPEIARQLGVTHLVEGSVRKAGERVRITAQLINAQDGFHLWSDTFDRELQDIFAVQDEIAGLIAKSLRLKLEGPGREVRPVNPEAHRLVLEARFFWAMRSMEAFDRAEQACSRALDIDPQFAPAHACLADVYVVREWYRLDSRTAARAGLERGIAAARLAREYAPGLAEPCAALGAALYTLGNFAESEVEFQRAIAINPNYATAYHWHAHLLGTQGYSAAATAAFRRSLDLDPLAPATLIIYAQHLNYLRRYSEAVGIIDRALALRPGIYLPAHGERAILFFGMGRVDDAVAEARIIADDPMVEPRWFCDGDAVFVLQQAGLSREAEAHATRARSRIAPCSFRHAFILAALGRFDEVFQAMEQATPAGCWRLFYSPIWDPLRDDPRMIVLLNKLGCANGYLRARRSLECPAPGGES